jgi:hypothetical protein
MRFCRFYSFIKLKIWPTEFGEIWKKLDFLILAGGSSISVFFKATNIMSVSFFGATNNGDLEFGLLEFFSPRKKVFFAISKS